MWKIIFTLVKICSPNPLAWLSLFHSANRTGYAPFAILWKKHQSTSNLLTQKWAKAPINCLSNQPNNHNQSYMEVNEPINPTPTLFFRATCLHWLLAQSWSALLYIESRFLPSSLIFYPEDGDSRFIRNVGNKAHIHTAAPKADQLFVCISSFCPTFLPH
jgi:hypothetical protein